MDDVLRSFVKPNNHNEASLNTDEENKLGRELIAILPNRIHHHIKCERSGAQCSKTLLIAPCFEWQLFHVIHGPLLPGVGAAGIICLGLAFWTFAA